MRHSKIPLQLLLRVAPTLMADHHHRIVVETRPPADDRCIVAEGAIAMKLDEIGEREADVVRGKRTSRVARNLAVRPGRDARAASV